MEEDQQFCLRWNNHQSTLISVFDTLLENGTLVDCTLAAEGKFLKAHKVVLSACSPYFATLLSQQYDKHPIFILKDVKFQELRAMMDYMYRGEVNISQDQLGALLKAAESLQIKGLSDNRTNNNSTQKNETKQPEPASKSGLTIEQKRPRNSAIDIDSDIAGSREGSTSPTSRKRKKVRRRSNEALIDNHDHLSNSSSQSLPHAASTSGSANLATSVVNVTKKTEILQQQIENKGIATGIVHVMSENLEDPGNNQTMNDDEDDGDDDCDNEVEAAHNKKDLDLAHAKNKSTNAEMLLEPKNEYDDGHDENVEDLTLEDEDLLEDMEHPGPSHGGEGSSHGYSQWQVERSQDESFMTTQESVTGQHRDAQELLTCTPSIYSSLNNTNETERFYCPICNKSYLRKRHLQRHMRDECIGIPPRFHCELCSSKFRRKYHLVRHLHSKHGILPIKLEGASSPAASQSVGPSITVKSEQEMLQHRNNHVSINALLLKKENFENNFLPDIKQMEELQKMLVNINNERNLTLSNPNNTSGGLAYLKYMSH